MSHGAMFFSIPSGSIASTCRSCFKSIYWINTPRGRKMPVSTAIEGGKEPTSEAHGQGVSHFADCPDAKLHRRAR